ncbi:MAG: GTPase [Blastocatellia bacterium]
MTNNAQLQAEMKEVQSELKDALQELQTSVGNKLKPHEKAEIQQEFDQLIDLLERLETGKIFLALFGKTCVGKSAIINSLLGQDIAIVGLKKDLTSRVTPYEKDAWMLSDMPGIMGKSEFEAMALEEAKKSHGHIFVIEDEPYGPEMTMFELAHEALPQIPRIVFVNKWDEKQLTKTDEELAELKYLIEQKMMKFVKSPGDIVYGSAQLKVGNKKVRQELPQLLDRMHEDAGTLGTIMNILNPSEQAASLSETVRKKIFEVRTKVARKVISGFGAASAVSTFVPYSTLVVTPGLLSSMVYILFRVMGRKDISREDAKKVATDLIKECGKNLAAEFVAVAGAEILLDSVKILGPFGAIIGIIGDVVGLTYFRYRRTVILGEVTIEYIRTNGKWEADGAEATIKRCKERALNYYMRLRRSV